MSDDIVTRLRDVAPHAKAADPLSADPFLWSLTGLVNGAADEIERLRAEVDSKDAQAYRHLRRLYDERGEAIAKLEDEIRELGNALTSISKSRDRAIRALTEAVRGE